MQVQALFNFEFNFSLFNFEFVLGFLCIPREVFDIMYEDLSYGYYSLLFKGSGKCLPMTLILRFFSFILYIPTKLFWVAQTKNNLNVRRP